MGLNIPKPILQISNFRNTVSNTGFSTLSALPSIKTFICMFIAFITVYILKSLSSGARVTSRPPGPPRRLFGLNKSSTGVPPWKAFTMLQKKFGPVSSLYQGRTLLVVLGTVKAATDLLDKRGSIYSSRPRNIMASELMSGGMRGLSMPYSQRWRNWRSLMHAGMGIEAAQGYKALQALESIILLHDLIQEKNVKKYAGHLRRFAISIVYCVAYGRRVHTLDDPLVVANLQTDERFISYSTPGKYIVESWPILLKLPRFLQWFAYEPRRQRAADTELYLSLLRGVQAQMAVGPDAAAPSTARRALEKQGKLNAFGLDELETAYALSAPFSAGVGTTLATLEVFFLAMLNYPDVMRRAQAEIDALLGVGGLHRLPEFEDSEALPYVRAVIKETMRWRPIAPLGVPHSVTTDDTYQGMHIPNGSTVFANIYSMSKDEEMFPSAEEFKPERYLDLDPSRSKVQSRSTNPGPHSTFFFGFGRRICPGMHVAQNSLFIVVTRILWAFKIVPPKDASGNSIIPSPDDFVGGLVIRPRPFNFILEPRTDRGDDVSALIEEEWKRALEQASVWG